MSASRRAFLDDQLAAAIHDASARASLAHPAVLLTDRDAVTATLVHQLLDVLDQGLSFCAHTPTTVPTLTTWGPGMPTLACYLDAISFAATHRYDSCDACRVPAPDGTLLEVLAPVGPVLLVAAVCHRCRRRRARGDRAIDLQAAATRVALHVLARLEDHQ